jgi:predicted AAA+ superfamily ATPase
LVNEGITHNYEVYYWRNDKSEVDFVLRKGDKLLGIEVKTNFEKPTQSFQLFLEKYPKARTILVGPSGIKLEEFFRTPLEKYLASMK